MKELFTKIRFFVKKQFSKRDNIKSHDEIKDNKDILIFLIFLLISTGFWFFNALKDDYTSVFTYTVNFENIPENSTITESSVQKVQIKVRANGYILLRQHMGGSLKLMTYDVGQMRKTVKNKQTLAFIVSEEQGASLLNQLLPGIELLEISPDTIFLQLDELISKPLPIQLSGKIELDKQLIQAGEITFNPGVIVVTGPKSILDTLKFIPTEKMSNERLRSSIKKNINLKVFDKLEYEQLYSEITVPVESFTEQILSVPIEISDLPDSFRIKTFPPEVNVTFRAGLSQFESIKYSDFKIVVDGNTAIDDDRPPKLRVQLVKTPENVHSVSLSPLFVEYLIERKR